jgi:hypothetical protein
LTNADNSAIIQLKTDNQQVMCEITGTVTISESTQTDSVEFNLKKVEFYGIRLSFFARKEVANMRERTRHDSSTAELITLEELCQLYAVGLNSARTLAKKANAVLHIGRNVRIVKSRLDSYIEDLIEE